MRNISTLSDLRLEEAHKISIVSVQKNLRNSIGLIFEEIDIHPLIEISLVPVYIISYDFIQSIFIRFFYIFIKSIFLSDSQTIGTHLEPWEIPSSETIEVEPKKKHKTFYRRACCNFCPECRAVNSGPTIGNIPD